MRLAGETESSEKGGTPTLSRSKESYVNSEALMALHYAASVYRHKNKWHGTLQVVLKKAAFLKAAFFFFLILAVLREKARMPRTEERG